MPQLFQLFSFCSCPYLSSRLSHIYSILPSSLRRMLSLSFSFLQWISVMHRNIEIGISFQIVSNGFIELLFPKWNKNFERYSIQPAICTAYIHVGYSNVERKGWGPFIRYWIDFTFIQMIHFYNRIMQCKITCKNLKI